MLIDFTVLGQAQGSELFTAVIPKAEVELRISMLSEYGFDVETIDVDTVPVAARLMTAAPADSFNLLLDVGASETTGVFFKEGRILQVRSFPFGGDNVTNALSGALGISFVEAEARKRRGDTAVAEEEITEACQKFFASLKNTTSSLRMSGLVDEDPATLWLTGGGSLYRKLAEDLSRMLAAPVERVNVTQLAGIKPVGGDDAGWDSMIMNGALALALRPMAKGPGFNFRQGGFRRKGRGPQARSRHQPQVGGRRGSPHSPACRRRSHALLLRRQGPARPTQGRDDSPSAEELSRGDARRRPGTAVPLEDRRGKAPRRITAACGLGQTPSLGVMKDLSEQVPEASDLVITALVFDGDKVDIRGEASGFDAAETIKKKLETTGRYASIAVSSSNAEAGKPRGVRAENHSGEETMKKFWDNLGAREKLYILAGAGIVAADPPRPVRDPALLGGTGRAWQRPSMPRRRSSKEMNAQLAEYRVFKRDMETIQRAMASRPPNFTLYSFVERKAREAGVRPNVKAINPSRGMSAGTYEEAMADVSLEKITLRQLVQFPLPGGLAARCRTGSESSPCARAWRAPSISTVTVQLATYQAAAAPRPGPAPARQGG